MTSNGNNDQETPQGSTESQGAGGNGETIPTQKPKPTGKKGKGKAGKKGRESPARESGDSEKIHLIDPDKVFVHQQRVKLEKGWVEKLKGMILEGIEIDPLDGYPEEGDDLIYSDDGAHRVDAFKQLGRPVPMIFREGGKRKAFIKSLSANSRSTLRLKNADKRKAVMAALEDDEFKNLSYSDIAKLTGTSHTFVANVKNGKKVARKAKDGDKSPETIEDRKTAPSRKQDSTAKETDGVSDDAARSSAQSAGSPAMPSNGKVDVLKALDDVLSRLRDLPDGSCTASEEGRNAVESIQRELERLLKPLQSEE